MLTYLGTKIWPLVTFPVHYNFVVPKLHSGAAIKMLKNCFFLNCYIFTPKSHILFFYTFLVNLRPELQNATNETSLSLLVLIIWFFEYSKKKQKKSDFAQNCNKNIQKGQKRD